MIAFGPVPSRRLGKSLGVNNVPYKFCTYSCVYCQLGPTKNLTLTRRNFYDPEKVIEEVRKKYLETSPDFVTFVPDGEPTLDLNLGKEISGIKELGAKVAVLTNSSLLYLEEVREDLLEADLVSIKLDSVSENRWRRINRPHPSLDLSKVLEGIEEFSKSFKGDLISETMILRSEVDPEDLREVAKFLSKVKISKAYLTAPVRPPAEPWVKMPREEEALASYRIFSEVLGEAVELLIHPEPPEAYSGGEFESEVLAISSVHPIREDMMREILRRTSASEEDLRRLIEEGKIVEIEYEGRKYYFRSFRKIRER